MKVLVCIKQVPDMESRFKPNAAGTWFSESDLAWRMNEYDEYAVEQAVQIKEQLGNEPEITVLSIGPDRIGDALKKALAMGCDRAVHVQDNDPAAKDPWQIASIIATYAKVQGFDLIFTGMQSQDRGSAQVGAMVAELLEYACVTTIVGFDFTDGVATVKRELEGGIKGIVRLKTPALFTCQLGLNIPRYPTLPNIMKAKKKEMQSIAVADLLNVEKQSSTISFHAPARRGSGVVLEGDVGPMVDQLLAILKDKTSILR
ncbi:MAG: electron transfer flavoprotein subunit beta/FixA family protein [Oryzomonas sp.]|jgi:electron transfer flavoprotein beta subunit